MIRSNPRHKQPLLFVILYSANSQPVERTHANCQQANGWDLSHGGPDIPCFACSFHDARIILSVLHALGSLSELHAAMPLRRLLCKILLILWPVYTWCCRESLGKTQCSPLISSVDLSDSHVGSLKASCLHACHEIHSPV